MMLLLVAKSHNRWAALAVLFSYLNILNDTSWVNEWQGGVQAATNSLVLLLPPILIGSALDSRRYLRSPAPRLKLDGKKSSGRLFLIYISSCFWPFAAATSLIALTLAVNAKVTGFYYPGTFVLLLPFVWIALYVVLGMLLGRILPLLVVAPLALLLGFVAPVLLASTPDSRPALLTLLDDGAVAAPIFLITSTLANQLIIFSNLLALAMVWIIKLSISPTIQMTKSTLIISLVSFLSCMIAVTIGPATRAEEATNKRGLRECLTTETHLSMCVWVNHDSLLEPGLQAAATLDKALTFWDQRPSHYIESGLSAPSDAISFGTGSVAPTESEFAHNLASSIVVYARCGTRQPAFTQDLLDREAWLMVKADYFTSAESTSKVMQVLRLPEHRQQAWWLSAPQPNRCT
jgi:hypothetical protein